MNAVYISAVRPLARPSAATAARRILNQSLRWFSVSQGRSASFDPKTYSPLAEYSTPNIKKILSKSILDKVSEDEAKTRIELAAVYRLFELGGWNENIYNHLTAKVVEKDGSESFLINPFGLKYSEITASSLIKVRIDGKIVDPGVTGDLFGINEPGFIIHSCVHDKRPDVKSVMHNHYQPAAAVGPVSYHDYTGIVIDMDEQASIVKDLGENNVLFLRNHGVITAGESVAEAWYLMYQLTHACDIVYMAGACSMGNSDNIYVPPEATVEKTFEVTRHKGMSGKKYGFKELSAYMRWLDTLDPSYRT